MKQPSLATLFQSLSNNCMLSDDGELARLLTGLRNPNGSWKKTRVGRHSEANKFLINQLLARGCGAGRLMDIGVSSGVTTAELVQDLESAGLAPSAIYAVDRCFDIYLVRLSQGFHVLVEENGHLLRLEYGPLNFSPWSSKKDWLTGAVVAKAILRSSAKKMLRGIKFPLSASKDDRMRRLRMLSPSLHRRSGVNVFAHDLFDDFDASLLGCASLVRIANVLNTNLLSGSQIQRIARNVGKLCEENAIFYVCRSTRRSTKASLFVVKDGRLELATNLCGGIDAESLLSNLDLTE